MDFETRDDETFQDSFEAIGAELASARLESGMQVTELAQLLRISRHYLKDLEAGDHSNLPEATYVSGYIRSLAREVGLDPEVMSQRYRSLVKQVSEKPAYQFPVDNQQPQRSGAMIASIMVIFAVGGYGGWYAAGKPDLLAGMFGSPEPEVAAVMPQVEITVTEPDNLISGEGLISGEVLISGEEEAQPLASSTGAPAAAAAAADAVGETKDLAASPLVDGADVTPVNGEGTDAGDAPVALAVGETPAGAPPVDDVVPADLAATAIQSSAPQSSVALEAPALETAALQSDGGGTAGEMAQDTTPLADGLPADDTTSGATTGATDLAASGEASQPATTAEQTVGAANGDAVAGAEPLSRGGVAFARQRLPEQEITVRATGISWVEIIRNDGEEVMTKLMREGEIYVVDSRDKLYLSTGNAGGLELLFHDGSVRAIGESGEILRDLPLDADRLRNQL
jgi:cytoskeleton protein RodZ